MIEHDQPVGVGQSPTLGIRGVLALRDLAAGEVVEVPPLLPIPEGDLVLLDRTILGKYLFSVQGSTVLCLGLGSLYNHSPRPNAAMVQLGRRLVVKTLAPIGAGEELLISYGDDQEAVAARYSFDAPL